MRRYIKILFIATILTFMLVLSQAIAVDEAKLAKSAEILWQKWMSVFSKDVIITIQGVDDLWRSSKYVFVNGSEDLKVVKTNLIVPSYRLFVRFKLVWVGTNHYSEHAVPSSSEGGLAGFLTFEDSRGHTDEGDFAGGGMVFEYNLKYDLVGDKWVLRDTYNYDSPFDNENLYGEENKHLFKKLISVPIEDLQ